MKMNSKTGIISICRKAGRMVMGMDMVKDACYSGKAAAVFIAEDFSDKSKKEARYVCGRYGVKLYELGMTMDEIGGCAGKRSGIIAVTDQGFAKSMAKGLEEVITETTEY
ncbi:MAG: ribosomal L7Ae/L30e/S12e/Gadd45 family protein [Ruminococcus sp.]|nr:ribosomal L7Ae/L30e/S12e/Gadd45 family protein [Ruminococcus sp.]